MVSVNILRRPAPLTATPHKPTVPYRVADEIMRLVSLRMPLFPLGRIFARDLATAQVFAISAPIILSNTIVFPPMKANIPLHTILALVEMPVLHCLVTVKIR